MPASIATSSRRRPLATVAAVPLGSWLGEVRGWRGVFALGAGVAVLALGVQVATLPSVPTTAAGRLRALVQTLRSRVVLLGLFAVLLVLGGHFSGFTYIRPAVEGMSDIGSGGLAVLLLVFGVAGLVGTVVSGPLADRVPRVGVLGFPAAVGAGILVLHATGGSTAGLFAAMALWGLGFGGVPTTVLSWGARAEPDRLEQVGGLIVTVCNAAIAVGAVVGGVLVDGVDDTAPLVVGGLAALVGAAVLTGLGRQG